jgi:hypothetical protein
MVYPHKKTRIFEKIQERFLKQVLKPGPGNGYFPGESSR